MDFEKVLRGRKSVRKFSSREVSWKDLADVLEAGTLAPSSGNLQSWVFVVVRDAKNRAALVEALPREQSWAGKAPVLVVICSDVERVRTMYGARGEALYAVQNCAAAAENMLLKAVDAGIGACWIGYFDEKPIAKLLELDKDLRPQAVLALGYGEPLEEKPREPLQSFVFFEKFGNRKRDVEVWPLAHAAGRVAEKVKHKLSGLKK